MPDEPSDLVADAAASVSEDYYTLAPDGQPILQRSRAQVIHDTLRLLDLKPGMRVIEIGSGSGYSGANIAELVGPSGQVVSVDVDPGLVARAARLHDGRGLGDRITMVCGDGLTWRSGGPYDRVVSWAVPRLLPAAWTEQATDGAVIVASVKIGELALVNAMLRLQVNDGEPRLVGSSLGYFLDATDTGQPDEFLPAHYVDAAAATGDERSPWAWISNPRLRSRPGSAAEMLERLRTARPLDSADGGTSQRWRELRAWTCTARTTPSSWRG